MLSEMEVAPIETIAMVRLIRYLNKFEQMENEPWSKVFLLKCQSIGIGQSYA
jgi:hypothetical protein